VMNRMLNADSRAFGIVIAAYDGISA
jgi:hypothetical protein